MERQVRRQAAGLLAVACVLWIEALLPPAFAAQAVTDASVLLALARQARGTSSGSPNSAAESFDRMSEERFGMQQGGPVGVLVESTVVVHGARDMVGKLGIRDVLAITTSRDRLRVVLRQQLLDLADNLSTIDPYAGTCVHVAKPKTLDAPDISRVELVRGDHRIPPTINDVVAILMTNAFGAKTTRHSGSVCWPANSFDPTQRVMLVFYIGGHGPVEAEITAAFLADLVRK